MICASNNNNNNNNNGERNSVHLTLVNALLLTIVGNCVMGAQSEPETTVAEMVQRYTNAEKHSDREAAKRSLYELQGDERYRAFWLVTMQAPEGMAIGFANKLIYEGALDEAGAARLLAKMAEWSSVGVQEMLGTASFKNTLETSRWLARQWGKRVLQSTEACVDEEDVAHTVGAVARVLAEHATEEDTALLMSLMDRCPASRTLWISLVRAGVLNEKMLERAPEVYRDESLTQMTRVAAATAVCLRSEDATKWVGIKNDPLATIRSPSEVVRCGVRLAESWSAWINPSAYALSFAKTRVEAYLTQYGELSIVEWFSPIPKSDDAHSLYMDIMRGLAVLGVLDIEGVPFAREVANAYLGAGNEMVNGMLARILAKRWPRDLLSKLDRIQSVEHPEAVLATIVFYHPELEDEVRRLTGADYAKPLQAYQKHGEIGALGQAYNLLSRRGPR